jgi:hypothetical protein
MFPAKETFVVETTTEDEELHGKNEMGLDKSEVRTAEGSTYGTPGV